MTIRMIREHLRAQGCSERAAGVQWFFKEEVRSYGWKTADLRRYAREVHRELSAQPQVLLDTAERLFCGAYLEEKALAVVMLERSLRTFGEAEFRRFTGWLDRVTTWADHDALAMYLLGPMMYEKPARARRVFTWARSRNRWRRRAAAVSLIHGVRKGVFTAEAASIATLLVDDRDDMVQKGLGWLLREWGKVRPNETVPLLMSLRARATRLVLRTACERLTPAQRAAVLSPSDVSARSASAPYRIPDP
jgi:3-methyladenine DNA glycosylase AlkD